MKTTLTAAPRRRPARRAHSCVTHPAQQNVITFFENLLSGVKEVVPAYPASKMTQARKTEGNLNRYLFRFGNEGYIEVSVYSPEGGAL
jgi:hypothetical protein